MTPNQTRSLARELDGTHPLLVIRCDDEEWLRDELFSAVPADSEYRTWSAVRGLVDGRMGGETIRGSENAAAALTWIALRNSPERAVTAFFDLCRHLDEPLACRALHEAVATARRTFGTVVLAERDPRLPTGFAAESSSWSPPIPDGAMLETVVRAALRDARKTRAITAEVTRSTLEGILRGLQGLTRRQAERVIYACVIDDDRLDASDLPRLVMHKRNALGDLGGVLEFVQAPVSLDQVGGLDALKKWLLARRHALSDDAVAYGIRPPRGVLLLGVQGAGKSLAAKAIATGWGLPLLRLDAGALFDKFVGESERKLRDSLAQADRMAPAVLWIDEIEKGFASASIQSSDGGLSRRMFASLLTWMQERSSSIFLAATANDITALPPELLRKGRFDEIFFVDLPTVEARKAIVSIHLSKRRRDPAHFDSAAIARAAEGYSGAEIEAAIEAALHRAYADAKREVVTADVIAALQSSPPLSIVMADRIAALREWAASRCVPAD